MSSQIAATASDATAQPVYGAIDPTDVPTVAVRELATALKVLADDVMALARASEWSDEDFRRVEQFFWQRFPRDRQRKIAALVRLRSLIAVCKARRMQKLIAEHGTAAVHSIIEAAASMRLNTSFGFKTSELDHPELSQPGFFGEITVRFRLEEWPGCAQMPGAASFTFDNNEPPDVDILAIPEYAFESGVVPVYYRIFDKERNPANIAVKVDLGDGEGFRPAHEFPRAPSEGIVNLTTQDRADFGNPDAPHHVFLWDARTQLAPTQTRIKLAITASDREAGSRSILPALSGVTGLRSMGEIPIGDLPGLLLGGDFDGDGKKEIVIAN